LRAIRSNDNFSQNSNCIFWGNPDAEAGVNFSFVTSTNLPERLIEVLDELTKERYIRSEGYPKDSPGFIVGVVKEGTELELHTFKTKREVTELISRLSPKVSPEKPEKKR